MMLFDKRRSPITGDILGKGNTAQRLALYRKRAAATTHPAYKDWRANRFGRITSVQVITHKEGHPEVWYTEDRHQIGTYLGDAHELKGSRVDGTGWYVDDIQCETMIGGVARLRTSRGTYYIPVTHCTSWDGTIHWLGHAEIVSHDKTNSMADGEWTHERARNHAARTANGLAQSEAEDAREDNAQFLAEQDIEQARERIHELNKEVLPLLRELKQQRAVSSSNLWPAHKMSPAICKALRAHLARLIAERKEEFATITARQKDYWTAVQS
jgi:rRNA maturation endonuclease Nob1